MQPSGVTLAAQSLLAEVTPQGAQQAQAQSQQAMDTFKKAAGVFLEGRGYPVKYRPPIAGDAFPKRDGR